MDDAQLQGLRQRRDVIRAQQLRQHAQVKLPLGRGDAEHVKDHYQKINIFAKFQYEFEPMKNVFLARVLIQF